MASTMAALSNRKQMVSRMASKSHTKYDPSHNLISPRETVFCLEGNHAGTCDGHGENKKANLSHIRRFSKRVSASRTCTPMSDRDKMLSPGAVESPAN